MKRFLLLVLACCAVRIEGDVPKGPIGPEEVQKRVTDEVLSLIEVAIKVAQYTNVEEKKKAIGWVQSRVDSIKEILEVSVPDTQAPPVYYKDCRSLKDEGFTDSGVYDIYPGDPEVITEPMSVYCDQVTDGGGWIVFQRRQDGTQSFEQNWETYRHGFGDLNGEFWLGNGKLAELTKPSGLSGDLGGGVELRVDITDWADGTAYAQYSNFQVSGFLYTLTAEGYLETSTAGNALDYHNGMDFTTTDNDNDGASGGNCAVWMRGGWWFNYCLTADPNGPYLFPDVEYGAYTPGQDQGVTWTTYEAHGYDRRNYSLKGTEMKLRRAPSIST